MKRMQMFLFVMVFIILIFHGFCLPAFADVEPLLLFDMDLTGYNPKLTTDSRGITDLTGTSGAEIHLMEGRRATDNNLTGDFGIGRFTNPYGKSVPYAELNTVLRQAGGVGATSARIWIDSEEWHGKSYTTEIWVKADFYRYGKLLSVYDGQSADRTNSLNDAVSMGFHTDTIPFWFGKSDSIPKKVPQQTEEWLHVVITRKIEDGIALHSAYINGVLQFEPQIFDTTDNFVTETAESGFAGVVLGSASNYNLYTSDCIRIAATRVYDGVLSADVIAELYEEQKLTYTPVDPGARLYIADKSGFILDGYINYSNLIDEHTVVCNFDNPDMEKNMDCRVYAGVFNEGNLKKLILFESVSIPPAAIDYQQTFVLKGIQSVAQKSDVVKFFIWTEELYPLMQDKYFYINDDIPVNSRDGTWLYLKTSKRLAGEGIVPENFTVTDGKKGYNVNEALYYPFRQELKLKLTENIADTGSYYIKAYLKNTDGNETVLNAKAAMVQENPSPLYRDSIKEIKLYKNGEAVSKASDNGIYEAEVRVILQDKDRTEPLTVTLYKNNGDTLTELAQGTISSLSGEDFIFKVSCELSTDDLLCAIID